MVASVSEDMLLLQARPSCPFFCPFLLLFPTEELCLGLFLINHFFHPLQEVQRAMLDSIHGLEEEQELNEEIHGPGFFKDELMEICGIKSQVKSLKRRAMDLEKTISACVHDMHTMQQMLSVVDEAKALKLGTGLRDNTKV